jgi:hypothetical protein
MSELVTPVVLGDYHVTPGVAAAETHHLMHIVNPQPRVLVGQQIDRLHIGLGGPGRAKQAILTVESAQLPVCLRPAAVFLWK